MKVSKGQSQPKIVAAAFRVLYMVLGSPFVWQVLIVTQVKNVMEQQPSYDWVLWIDCDAFFMEPGDGFGCFTFHSVLPKRCAFHTLSHVYADVYVGTLVDP